MIGEEGDVIIRCNSYDKKSIKKGESFLTPQSSLPKEIRLSTGNIPINNSNLLSAKSLYSLCLGCVNTLTTKLIVVNSPLLFRV